MFRCLVFCVSIWFGCSCFSAFSVSIPVEGPYSYFSQFICPHISSISKSEIQPFFDIIQAWSAIF